MRGAMRIASDRIAVEVIAFGASVVSVEVPDRDGVVDNVVVALPNDEQYRDPARNAYLGAMVGRYANRIAGARFTLDDVVHRLDANDGPNTLHGGADGWGRRDWALQAHEPDAITFRLDSDAGDGGFPGDVISMVEYRVEGATLAISASMLVSAATPVSLTNHTYWNLAGAARATTIDDHHLHLVPTEYLAVDDQLIPTGERHSLAALMDGERLAGQVLDHCAVAEWDPWDSGWEPTLATHVATLFDPRSGRRMWMRSNQPGLQIYSADKLGIGARRGLALEAQQLPDAPNQAAFPSPVVRPGDGLRGTVRWSVGYVFDVA